MTPSGFQFLVKNFTRLDSAEHEFVQSLLAAHPYSQLLHVLVARSSKDHGKPDQASRLNRAAVYATDRSIVKWAVTTPARARIEAQTPKAEIKQQAAPAKEVVAEATVKETPVKKSAPVRQATEVKEAVAVKDATPTKEVVAVKAKLIERSALEGDALRADLATELKRLQQWKRDFQVSYEKFKTNNPASNATKVEKAITPDRVDDQEPGIIEEIKTTRKKLKIPSPKVAEQGEIIDNFIKVAPSIPKPSASTPAADLSIDSATYGDHVVSETLVDILVKQGKKTKAIEMLKKLIWKFPQKKAYFAAQIEALKD